MMLTDDEVARTYLEVLASCLFLLPSCILGKYVWYEICSSDIALSEENKAGSIRSRQHDSTVWTFVQRLMHRMLVHQRHFNARNGLLPQNKMHSNGYNRCAIMNGGLNVLLAYLAYT